MPSEWKWRGALVAFVAIVAVYLLIPSYYYFRMSPEIRNDKAEQAKALPGWFKAVPEEFRPTPLHLGLDLQGGIHLVMEVDVDAGIMAKANNRANEMVDYLTKKGITGFTGKSVNRYEVQLTAPAGKLDSAETTLSDYFNDMDRVATAGDSVTYGFKPDVVKHLKDDAVDQSIRAIRNRVDKFGVTEPTISRQGENHILVQLPGFKDPEQAKELIGKTAQLEFRMVDEEKDQTAIVPADQIPAGVEADHRQHVFKAKDEKTLEDFVKNVADAKAPAGDAFLIGHNEDPTATSEWRTYLVKDHAELTGDTLTDARVMFDSDGVSKEPYVSIQFNKAGADKFEELTGANIGKYMAIVLDGVVNSAPVIKSKIPGGNAKIEMGRGRAGSDTMTESRNLALVLKAGALPAPVTIAEQRTVGASLGPELITSGRNAVIAGLLLVVTFMLIYYNLSGIMADVALILNGLLILASLALAGAALSLPGIAGIVLTLGVSVDANVIINERIREELRAGKSPRTAVSMGYDRAFSAIFDSNLTTVIAGVVLMQYGTGPIRGFAITLVIGVIASMFTAIFVTRWMMDLLVAKRPERLSV